MRTLAILAALVLAGCAANPRAVGNEASVIVTDSGTAARAFDMAGEHCAKYGKSARFHYGSSESAAFDCK